MSPNLELAITVRQVNEVLGVLARCRPPRHADNEPVIRIATMLHQLRPVKTAPPKEPDHDRSDEPRD